MNWNQSFSGNLLKFLFASHSLAGASEKQTTTSTPVLKSAQTETALSQEKRLSGANMLAKAPSRDGASHVLTMYLPAMCLPIPKKLLKESVRDMVRISDARISGTSYGTCILHVSPESHLGGPLALVQTGDEIELDVANRSIHWHVSDEEFAKRKSAWTAPEPKWTRGYHALFAKHVTQAHLGCDFDFLAGRSPGQEPDIF